MLFLKNTQLHNIYPKQQRFEYFYVNMKQTLRKGICYTLQLPTLGFFFVYCCFLIFKGETIHYWIITDTYLLLVVLARWLTANHLYDYLSLNEFVKISAHHFLSQSLILHYCCILFEAKTVHINHVLKKHSICFAGP